MSEQTDKSVTSQPNESLYDEYPHNSYNILKDLKDPKKYRNKKVLCAGCGAGEQLFDLYFYGAEVTGVDQSSGSIEFIRTQFEEMGAEQPELVVGDLASVGLPRDEYDYVLCLGVLNHAENPDQILDNLRKALKPQGTLEAMVWHTNSPAIVEQKLLETANSTVGIADLLSKETKLRVNWWDKYENPLWRSYTREEFRTLFVNAGFSVSDLWVASPLFGVFTRQLFPPVVRGYLRNKFDEYGMLLYIESSIE